MKNTFSRLVVVALTMWLGLAAGSARADALTFEGWSYGGGVASSNFGNSGLDASQSYTDWLNFSLPGGSTGQGDADEITLKFLGGGVVDSFTLWLTNAAWTPLVQIATGIPLLGGAGSYLAWNVGPVPGHYQLQTTVHGASAYAGNIATPVPEPETFAMLIAGLGLLGFSARRRNSNT
jgi:hypothetical protein